MALNVQSEIGRLRRVLIHRPGREIDWMVPSMMERLLFEDILYSDRARQEHDAFAAVLRAAGVETVDPEALLADVVGEPEVRGRLIARLERLGVSFGVLRELETLAPPILAAALITGIPAGRDARLDGRLESFYRLPPVPNYFFQRDPQVVFGDRVLLAAMATDAREREPLLARTAFESHPTLAGCEILTLEEGPAGGRPASAAAGPKLEGGDVLVPAPEVLMVGLSERTNRRGIEALARRLRRAAAAGESAFRYLVMVEVPARRSYMHLDTVFTFIDRGLCLAYLPVIAPGGAEAGAVYRIDLKAAELAYTVCDHLPGALSEIGHEIELVPCGGSESLIDQQREQWTDGANAFAIAPGVIALYRRNLRTTEELARRGFRVLAEEDVIAGRDDLLGHGPTVVTLMDHELSRARGGPRCMTMPLVRDDLG
jgi:arginine deiminase